MRNKKILVILLIGIIFANCKNENKIFDTFYESEKVNLINAANEILLKLGLKDFEVIVYTHRGINNRVVSKAISDTNWHGSGFNPEFPSSVDNVAPVYSDMSNLFGWVRQRTLKADYDVKSKKEITYDNFSIIIVIENINQRQKTELLRLFDAYLLNIDRGDTIFIISKADFNNLE